MTHTRQTLAAMIESYAERFPTSAIPGDVVQGYPHSSVRPALMIRMYDAANGECAFCGDATDLLTGEACHVVPNVTNSWGGWANREDVVFTAFGCRGCNVLDKEDAEEGNALDVSDVLSPASVLTTWGDMSKGAIERDALRYAEVKNAHKVARRAARRGE